MTSTAVMQVVASPLLLLKDPSLIKAEGLIFGELMKLAPRFDVQDNIYCC
jgi:hypothetical protein